MLTVIGGFGGLGPYTEVTALIIFSAKTYSPEAESTDPAVTETPKSPKEVLESLKETLYGVMDPATLDRILNKQAIVLIGTQILTSSMMLSKESYSQDLKKGLTEASSGFYKKLGELTLLLIPFTINEITSTLVTDYYSRLLSETAQEALKERYFSEGNLLKLSRDPNTEVLVDRMDINILDTTLKGGTLISSAVKSHVGGTYAVCSLYSYKALDLALLMQAYIENIHSITIWLNEKQLYYESSIEELRSKLVSFQKEINRNAKLITSGDKEPLLLKNKQNLSSSLYCSPLRKLKSLGVSASLETYEKKETQQ